MKPPIHPGIALRAELNDHDMTQREFALRIGMSQKQVSLIINGKAPITADTALKAMYVLGKHPNYWTGLQLKYDLHRARQRARR